MIKWTRLLGAIPLLWAALVHLPGAQAEEFLDPEVAFKFSARALDADTLEARWQIADGYYMYRDKFRFELEGATLGEARLPPAKVKEDEYFGRVETYTKDVRIALPIKAAPGTKTVTLKTVSQGCADAGLCYTPQTVSAKVELPAPPVAAPASLAPVATAQAASGGLGSLMGDGGAPQLLPPDEAFLVKATMPTATTVRFDYTLTADTYLYRDKFVYTVKAPAGVSVSKNELPPGEVKDDPTFGRTEVYHRDLSANLTLSRALAAGETLVVEAGWQGCNEKVGVCYPPIKREFSLSASGGKADAAPSGTGAGESDTSRIERVLKSGSSWAVVATFFGFGLLLAFTPCVFPMIPILSGIIAGQKKTLTKANGFLLSLAYVLGMAITYALAGVAAALSGTLLSNALQNPWALGIGAGIFVLLALSMFGFFEIQLPSALQSKFSDASNRMKGGNFLGVFVMGALSAVIVGPCVAPPLAAALAFIAQTGNTTLGGVALFVLALGMGVPLLLVGVSAGALLPRAGGWMNAVKYFFGVLMLAIAIYLISPIIPSWIHMLLWALLLIAAAIYLHALDPLPQHASGWSRLWKGLGVVLLIGGLAMLLGMLAGSRDVLQPLDVFKRGAPGAGGSAAAAVPAGLRFEKVKDVAELDARLAAAKAEGRPVMLDFYADWCVSCKEMERFTFSDPKVQARLADVVLLKADVTANNAADKALLKRFGLFGPPGLIFWNSAGVQSDYKVIGFEKAEKFLASVDAALGT
ncbi:thiol:disulfide interchange protein DsbD [Thiobacillus denitrificans ATCC 25259]|uniref:Thiol:disulfide interchange protein DsbD n=1 Tax=Thiobacillus denitrificans (strain ATCC 25259 / T1) TaxID=292415 RepID=Q3SFU4_THIDA|nr:protein-disulfide reductase DsbD [Thiobacillus denitrificans]AAZ98512.1 thiol:disulfide interchange protein DsbD [Thiobacillus denitrificans ATCC 25259]